MQVQFNTFRKKIATLLTLETLKWETFATAVYIKLGSLLSVTCRHHGQRIMLTMTGEIPIIKLGVTTGAGISRGKSVQAPIRFVMTL